MVTDWYPGNWKPTKLSELGKIDRGRSRHRPRYAPHLYGGPYPFIQTGDIKASGGKITTYSQTYSDAGLAQSKLWQAGTLCITIAANIAETGILTFPACFPDSVVGFIADKTKCDVYFVEYMFRYLRSRIQHEASGSVQDNINLATLNRLEFPLPPLPEQRAIAGILSALDDKIEVNRRMNITLESMARAVFRSWFIENPVSTKWKLLKIKDLGNLDKGISYKGAFLTNEGMPMINLGCFQGKGKFEIKNLRTYSGEYKERHTVKPGDIVLANTDITQKREVIGSPAIVPDYPAKEYLFTHHTYAFRVTDNSPVLKNYLYFTLLQEEFRERAEGFATGTTVLALPRDAVLDYKISMPPADLLQKFYEQVHPMLQKVQSNIKEAYALVSLRDSLLPKLMRGEVRVKVD